MPPSLSTSEDNSVAAKDDLNESIQSSQQATPQQQEQLSKTERKKNINKTAMCFITNVKSASSGQSIGNRAVDKAKKLYGFYLKQVSIREMI